ncbi:MAG TPA: glycoside hydrolase family 9 protein [Terriglobales bacterium]|nr:glycoside hydrolase family 9 protein [Terriglobales bacterium]
MNVGGWHDAGDDDLRIESQADEVSILARAYEAFGLDYDDTTVDESERIAKIHQPDGKPDALQQVEHGVLTVLGSFRAMGRFYRGIITPTLHQYTMLGDESNSTDNLFYDASLKSAERTATHSSKPDDRLLFTEQNAAHEYKGIAALAACGHVLKKYNPPLADECTQAAEALWSQPRNDEKAFNEKIVAAVELLLTTGKSAYRQFLLDQRSGIVASIDGTGWAVGRLPRRPRPAQRFRTPAQARAREQALKEKH